MNNLIIIAHPNTKESKISIEIKKYFASNNKENNEIVDLYEEYPDFKINVEKEQERLIKAENIIFVFPIYWYSVTPLLKQYMDKVFLYNFSYGNNYKLENKKWLAVTSSGKTKEGYKEIGKSLSDLTIFFDLTMSFMKLKKIGWINNFGAKEENIEKNIKEIKTLL